MARSFVRRSPWPTVIAALLVLLGVGLFGESRLPWHKGVPDCEAPPWPPLPVLQPRSDLPVLQVATYNLHSGLGPAWRPFMDRMTVERNLNAIARHLAAAGSATAPVDAVGLNEVDFGSRRTGWLDQAAFLGAELTRLTGESYRVIRGETWRRQLPGFEVRFGNALLLRHPVLASGTCRFDQPCAGTPGSAGGGGLVDSLLAEPRGVVRARIDFHGEPVEILSTHLEAVASARRETQAQRLIGHVVDPAVPTLLLGDINAVPFPATLGRFLSATDRTHTILTSGPLIDAREVAALRAGATDLSPWASYPAEAPRWPLDAILASLPLVPRGVEVVGALASDHRGVAARFDFLAPGEGDRLQAWHEAMRVHRRDRELSCTGRAVSPGRSKLTRLGWSSSYY